MASIWGSSYLLTKEAVAGLGPSTLILWRMFSGTLVLLAASRLLRLALPTSGRLWFHLALSSFLLYVVPQLLFAWAVERVDSHVAGLFSATIPLLSFVIALASRTERNVTAQLVGGLGVGMVGVIVLFAPWQVQGSPTMSGQLACLAASASSASAAVYMQRTGRNDGLNPVSRATCQLAVGTLITLVVFAVSPPVHLRLNPEVVVCATVLGVVGSGSAAVLYWRLIHLTGAVRASMVSYVTPVISIALGTILAGEHLTAHALFGGLLVLMGIAFSRSVNGNRITS